MIHSRNRTFNFWFLAFFVGVFLFLIFNSISDHYWGFRIGKIQLLSDRKFFHLILFFCTYLMLPILALWLNVKNIVINKDNRSISIQNIFTRAIQEYKFSDFDGYIDTYIKHNFYSSKTIGFVKDGKIIRRIDSLYYSNYDEIKEGLAELVYKGEVKFGFWKMLQMRLNYKVVM